MIETITAVYERGVLRPLRPLHLPEHSEVEIEVRTIHNPLDAHDQREQVRAVLDAAGILVPYNPPGSSPLSESERTALAERLIVPGAAPLSQLIIEDRGE